LLKTTICGRPCAVANTGTILGVDGGRRVQDRQQKVGMFDGGGGAIACRGVVVVRFG